VAVHLFAKCRKKLVEDLLFEKTGVYYHPISENNADSDSVVAQW
jgi:hypothetical protein